MGNSKKTAAVVGTGFIGPVHVEALRRIGIDVKGVLGSTPAKGAMVKDRFGLATAYTAYEEILADDDVKVGIENCPMLFSGDEWPGGKNLAISPDIWRRMFDAIPSKHFGLNFDPSHLVWQRIDYVRALHEFKDRIVHVHAKDDKTVADRLYDRGVMGLGWHIPKLPGLGDVQWNQFVSALTDIEYRGPVCVEIEDRAFEYSLEGRQKALRQSQHYLQQFFA